MNQLKELGRLLYGIPMIVFGVFHFVNMRSLSTIVPAIIPGDTFWVILTGAALIAAGVSIVIKKQVRMTCYFLAVMLLVFVFLVHLPGALNGEMLAINSLLKDAALSGGAIMLGQAYKD